MSVSVEKLEKSMAKLTIEVDADKVEKAIQNVYFKTKNRIQVPGFRKGKAPRTVIERMYGKGIFYEDAVDELVDNSYPDAMEECGEDIVSHPVIDVVQIESGKPFVYTAQVALKPSVGLGKYKGIEVEKFDTTVTDADVDAELERVRGLNARQVDVKDRAVQKDDIISLDFDGYVDGKPFEGGKSENYSLTIGSGSFIPGFEDQLIGKEIDVPCEVTVTFPEDYHEKTLAGKEAVFKCNVRGIRARELPELNDEFASDVSEFDTLDEYKEDTKKKLKEAKESEAGRKREDECMRALIEDCEIEIPEPMLEDEQKQLAQNFYYSLQMQGMNPDSYLQMLGSSHERLLEQFKPQAEDRIKARLALEAVADAEKLEATEEDIENKLKSLADEAHSDIEKVREMFSKGREAKNLRGDIRMEKAAKFISENAKEVDEVKNKKEKDKEKAKEEDK